MRSNLPRPRRAREVGRVRQDRPHRAAV